MVMPAVGSIPAPGKLICCCPPEEICMLPLVTAASAVGKVLGVVIPTTGTSSDPSNAATTTRVTCERNRSRIFFMLKENMLNTRVTPYAMYGLLIQS